MGEAGAYGNRYMSAQSDMDYAMSRATERAITREAKAEHAAKAYGIALGRAELKARVMLWIVRNRIGLTTEQTRELTAILGEEKS